MGAFNKGQRVHVEFDGIVNSESGGFLYLQVGVLSNAHAIPVGTDRYVITPLAPENWPPQAGDIWEADGTEFFAYAGCDEGIVCLVPKSLADAKIYGMSREADRFSALNPRLIRRSE